MGELQESKWQSAQSWRHPHTRGRRASTHADALICSFSLKACSFALPQKPVKAFFPWSASFVLIHRTHASNQHSADHSTPSEQTCLHSLGQLVQLVLVPLLESAGRVVPTVALARLDPGVGRLRPSWLVRPRRLGVICSATCPGHIRLVTDRRRGAGRLSRTGGAGLLLLLLVAVLGGGVVLGVELLSQGLVKLELAE